MSFRKRLTLFFVVIVVVPMLAVALVLYLLVSESESAKVSTRVEALVDAAENLYVVDEHDAGVRAAVLKIFGQAGGPTGDPALLEALRAGDVVGASRRAGVLARRDGVRRLAIYRTAPSETFADVGDRNAVAPDLRTLEIAGQDSIVIELALRSAQGFARIASQVTGATVVVTRGARVLAVGPAASADGSQVAAATLRAQAATVTAGLRGSASHLPSATTVTVSGQRYEVGSFTATAFRQEISVSVLVPSVAGSVIAHTRLLSALILGGLLTLAVALALLVSRSLQDQIANFLGAARRLGKGDLATRVPVSGRDEFAALGEEFNSMAGQLENRLEELGQQRRRLQRSLQRLGDSFAANLDRDAILGIVLRTAVDGSGARVGRAATVPTSGGPPVEIARVGPTADFDDVLSAAETDALASGESGASRVGETSALAHLLRGSDGSSGVLGVISVARPDGEFEDGERELFAYLARQAGVSVENVGLHEQVQRQAVTDELTGLFNHRRFLEAL
jgi:HAMP domain-containing protein